MVGGTVEIKQSGGDSWLFVCQGNQAVVANLTAFSLTDPGFNFVTVFDASSGISTGTQLASCTVRPASFYIANRGSGPPTLLFMSTSFLSSFPYLLYPLLFFSRFKVALYGYPLTTTCILSLLVRSPLSSALHCLSLPLCPLSICSSHLFASIPDIFFLESELFFGL